MMLPEQITCSSIGCRLDYSILVLLGVSVRNIQRLLCIQSTFARVVTRQSSCISISRTLKNLTWLPVKWRINFKVITLTYKVLAWGELSYLFMQIASVFPQCTLQASSDTRHLVVLPSRIKIGARGFHCSAPSIWNNIPFDIQAASSVQTFKSQLKTLYFQQTFD